MNKSGFFFKVINVLFAKFYVLAISFFVMIVLARGLGAEVRGELAYILVIPTVLISLCEGGMRQATTYFIGKNRHDRAEIIATMWLFIFLSSIAGFIITFLIQCKLNYSIDAKLVFLSALIIPFSLWVSSNRGVLLGLEKTRDFSKSLWIPRLIYLCCLLGLFYFNKLSLQSALISYLFMFLINAAQTTFQVKKCQIKFFLKKINFSLLKSMLKLGIVFSISLFFIDINYKIGLLTAKNNLEGDVLGNYAVTLQIVELVWQLPAALSIVLFSKSSNQSNYDSNWVDKIQKMCRLQLAICSVIAILISVLSFYFIPIIFGQEYKLVATMLSILMPGVAFMSVFKVLNVDLAGRGMPYVSLRFMPIVFFITAIATYFMSIKFGYIGLCVSVSISYLLATILLVRSYATICGGAVLDYLLLRKEDILKALELFKGRNLWAQGK